ncbi:MAG: alpha/beta hydrolase [Roseibium sp.]|nr:alpha/beta hydrolase [Roseibium sp.]
MFLALLILALLVLAAIAYTAFRLRQIHAEYEADGAFADFDGVRLHYHFFPAAAAGSAAPTLVFIHGASGNAYDQMLAFSERFAGAYALLFVDRPGLGFSGRDMRGHASPRAQAELIKRLLKQLEIDRCIVIGHSLGASVTAALGLIDPERVKGLVFLAPATHPWPGGVNWYYSVASWPLIGRLFCWTLTLPVAERLMEKSITRVFEPSPAPDGYAAAIKAPLLFRPHSFRANAMDIARLKPHLVEQSELYPDLLQPTVVITGSEDTVVWPSIHSEGLVRDLPNARLVVLDGTGHMPHHSDGPHVAAEIEKLVKDVNDAAGRFLLETQQTPEPT